MELAMAGLPTRTVRKQTLTALSHHIGGIAATAQNAPIVLATLHPDEHLDLQTEQMYSAIAERSPLVAVFGQKWPDRSWSPGPGCDARSRRSAVA
jgi:DICT domain-containing protein